MDWKQTYRVQRNHKCNTIDIREYGKLNPKTKKVNRMRKGVCDVCSRPHTKIFAS